MSSNPLALFLSRSTASPYAIVLSLGFGFISYSFWGSLAAQSIGAIAIPVNPNERRKLGLDTSKSVEVWNWAFGRGAVSLHIVLPHSRRYHVTEFFVSRNDRSILVYLVQRPP
jgi:hypothetical protein